MYFYHRISTTAPTATAPAIDTSSSTSFRSAYATAAACNHSSAVTDTYYVDPEQSGKLLVLFRIMQVRATLAHTQHIHTHTHTHIHTFTSPYSAHCFITRHQPLILTSPISSLLCCCSLPPLLFSLGLPLIPHITRVQSKISDTRTHTHIHAHTHTYTYTHRLFVP